MQNKYTAIIVDDERLARKELNSMLSNFNQIDIVGEADDVSTAKSLIQSAQPDVIFLDIQMPGKSGFDLLKEINIDAHIIFVTAFDEYAIRAFEVNALDYLLKPITNERLEKAVNRIKDHESSKEVFLNKLNYDDRLLLNIDSQLQFLKISSLVSINSAGDYSEIILSKGDKGLTNKSMKEWEQRLPENCFCRIHRSTIINMEFAEKLEEWFNYSYKIYLRGISEPYTISRRYVSKLKDKLK
jgi:two-component system, LytTR family, response regulator